MKDARGGKGEDGGEKRESERAEGRAGEREFRLRARFGRVLGDEKIFIGHRRDEES